MEHVLLLHGALGAASTLEPLKVALLDRYHVHTLNFTGHGGEALPQAGFSIEQFVQDVLEYLDQLVLPQVHIFGYSMGGYVALSLARQYPERVKSIFTLAAKFEWTPESAEKETRLLNPDKIEQKLPNFAKSLAERHSPENWKEVMRLTANMMLKLGTSPILTDAAFAEVQTPVQLGVGDSDAMVSIEETLHAFQCLSTSNLLVLPATRHPLENVTVKRLQLEVHTFIDSLLTT